MKQYTHRCSICHEKALDKAALPHLRYTADGNPILIPYICSSCLDEIEDSEEPDDIDDETLAPYTPEKKDSPFFEEGLSSPVLSIKIPFW